MRPEVAAALETLGWVATPEVPLLPDDGLCSDVFRLKEPLVVLYPDGEERLIAELFPYRDGAVFFECGWVFGGHPVHVLPGPIVKKGKGCWRFGDVVVRVVTREEFPVLALQAELWEVLKARDGEDASRERAYDIFLDSFGGRF